MGVYKKGNRWYADFYIDGKRKREVVKLEGVPPDKINRQDALKFLRIKQAQVAKGEYVANKTKPVLFDKLVRVFIEDYSKPNKKSWKRDQTSCRALLGHFGGRRITYVTPWTADKYKLKRLKETSRLNRTMTKATVNRELACLKTMLGFAVKKKWLISNPLSGYKLYTEKPNMLRVVSGEEFKTVYQAASEFLKPILIVAYNTGMRRGEILKLKWENVNLSDEYILVEETKNDEPRYIPINKQLNEALKLVKYSALGEYVFSHEGKPVKTFKTAFNAAIRRAGVKPFRFHDLRHTFASNLVMNGVDLATVQELMGHKSIAMTKRYSHPTPEHKKQAVEGLNEITMDTYLDTWVVNAKSKTNVTT